MYFIFYPTFFTKIPVMANYTIFITICQKKLQFLCYHVVTQFHAYATKSDLDAPHPKTTLQCLVPRDIYVKDTTIFYTLSKLVWSKEIVLDWGISNSMILIFHYPISYIELYRYVNYECLLHAWTRYVQTRHSPGSDAQKQLNKRWTNNFTSLSV